MHPAEATTLDRNDAIKLIREGLKRRSGKAWSVSGGRGTARGWITVQAPPARREGHKTSEADCAELAKLLGLARPVHCQGVSIPAASDYRRWYVAAAQGLAPIGDPRPYWD